jgi:uncharacterized integral membrane protein
MPASICWCAAVLCQSKGDQILLLLKRLIFAICILIVLLAGSIFAMRNSQSVTVDFVFGTSEWPLSVVVVVVFVLSALLGFLVGAANVLKLHASRKVLEIKLKQAEKSASGKGNKLPAEI